MSGNLLRSFGTSFVGKLIYEEENQGNLFLRGQLFPLIGSLFHFRDRNGLECDAVLHRRNGMYGLIEIKLGSEKGIEDGVDTLKTLASKIDTTKMQPPSFLMVLIASGEYAYRREDGVLVVPIGCLKD